ncbi:MAG: glycosyltransferase family 2 protein [Solirubrobacteraceae bacterium]
MANAEMEKRTNRTRTAQSSPISCAVVVPNWNGRGWLEGCLRSLADQTHPPGEVIVVDNGSSDGSVEFLRSEHRDVQVVELGHNTGFAHAANRGVREARAEFVALVNTDVELAPDWLERMVAVLRADTGCASAACKMLSMNDESRVYDAGDFLRRDGVCEQRGRFGLDEPRLDDPVEVFGACAGAVVYRREVFLDLGGFDERYFAYLEDVDLALRLQLAGWRCRYEPVIALHAGEQSSAQLSGGHWYLVERNTLMLVAKAFPSRWLGLVAYRQLAWLWHAVRERRLRWQLRGALAAIPLLPHALRERRRLRREARVPIEIAVAPRPIRGPKAEGHPSRLDELGKRADRESSRHGGDRQPPRAA